MDEGRDRSGAGHGIRQPQVERNLGRLAGRTDQQQHNDGGCGALLKTAGVAEYVEVSDRPDRGEGEERGDHEAPVANTVGDEGLLARRGVVFAGEPEGDQEVGTRPHAFPSEEGDEHVVAQHQHQHRECEQVEVEKELREVLVAVHVTDRVEVDQHAHPGYEQCHGDREWINQEADIDTEVAGRHPFEQGLNEMALFHRPVEQAEHDHDRAGERAAHHRSGEPARQRLSQTAAKHHDREEPEKGKCRYEENCVEHDVCLSLSVPKDHRLLHRDVDG